MSSGRVPLEQVPEPFRSQLALSQLTHKGLQVQGLEQLAANQQAAAAQGTGLRLPTALTQMLMHGAAPAGVNSKVQGKSGGTPVAGAQPGTTAFAISRKPVQGAAAAGGAAAGAAGGSAPKAAVAVAPGQQVVASAALVQAALPINHVKGQGFFTGAAAGQFPQGLPYTVQVRASQSPMLPEFDLSSCIRCASTRAT